MWDFDDAGISTSTTEQFEGPLNVKTLFVVCALVEAVAHSSQQLIPGVQAPPEGQPLTGQPLTTPGYLM